MFLFTPDDYINNSSHFFIRRMHKNECTKETGENSTTKFSFCSSWLCHIRRILKMQTSFPVFSYSKPYILICYEKYHNIIIFQLKKTTENKYLSDFMNNSCIAYIWLYLEWNKLNSYLYTPLLHWRKRTGIQRACLKFYDFCKERRAKDDRC